MGQNWMVLDKVAIGDLSPFHGENDVKMFRFIMSKKQSAIDESTPGID